MTSDHHKRLVEIFHAAQDATPDRRAAILDEACGDDAELRKEVEALLAEARDESAFLEEPALGKDFRIDDPMKNNPEQTIQSKSAAKAALPKKIGGYSIKHPLGSGGMGLVYVAQQENPRRVVALKVMKKGISSKSALRRFEYESQILARLRHPNIAKVYESGTHDDGEGGVPFFAMEYIANAKSIIDYATAKNLGTRDRLELFAKVCDAVHHGHQKGIIHRDLKPGNILVDSGGEPKIIDFGVARATDSDLAITTLQTDIGQLIGTLQYMSPEQCEGDPHDLDTRSDVYALGVVLYELLTDRLPYDVSNIALHAAARVIQEEEPARPSTVLKSLRGDVETIALKALEKDRERRYATTADLGRDMKRYLSNEPIEARPPSMSYQLSMFTRRHRAAVYGIAAVLVVLTAGVVVSSVFAIGQSRARGDAVDAEKLATRRQMEAEIAQEEASVAQAEAEASRDEAVQQTAIVTAVKEFLIDDMIRSADPDVQGGQALLVIDMIKQASDDVGEQFSDQPEVEAEIRLTLGIVLTKLGDNEVARAHLNESIGLFRSLQPEGSVREAETLAALSLSFANGERDYQEATRLGRASFEMFRRLVGKEDPRTQQSQADLSWFEALAAGERVPDLDNDNLMQVIAGAIGTGETPEQLRNRYLRLLHQVDRLWRERKHDEAKQIILDEAAPFFGNLLLKHYIPFSLSSYATFLYDQGALKGTALAMAEVAVEVGLEHLPAGHSKTLYAMGILGRIYVEEQRFDDAEAIFVPALEACRRTHGNDHPDTLVRLSDLAQLYLLTGRFAEAEPLLIEQFDRNEKANVDRKKQKLTSIMNSLIQLYESWEKPDKANEWRGRLASLTLTDE